MSANVEHKNQEAYGYVESESAAVSAALSVHYIVIALYALPAVAGLLMILMLSFISKADSNVVWWIVSSASFVFILLHLLAVKGLSARKKWGYNISIAMSLTLVLMFPFGTVLGGILISQLIKFRL